jgi:hypothetical protein
MNQDKYNNNDNDKYNDKDIYISLSVSETA